MWLLRCVSALLLFAGLATAAASAPVIVFTADERACYRIPSLAVLPDGYIAIAERRRGLEVADLCDDDGTIDLVAKTSRDGASWRKERVIVGADELGASMAMPGSPLYDPDFAAMPADRRMVRIGNQSVAASGRALTMLFTVRYNIVAVCGGTTTCRNSPENVKKGLARERFFSIRSSDGGRTWSAPARVHSEILSACIDRLITDPALKTALRQHFLDDRAGTTGVDRRHRRLTRALDRPRMNRARARAAAELLGVSPVSITANAATLRKLFRPLILVGPGNGVAFPRGTGTRMVFPSSPFGTYSDDGGATLRCSDTTNIVRGSERQVAWLGGDLLVMTLRIDGRFQPSDMVRLFATSRDGGETWTADNPIEVDGTELMPDPVAQASIVGIPGHSPPMAIHVNLANASAGTRRFWIFGGRIDLRNRLSAVRMYLTDQGLKPATRDGCALDSDAAEIAYYPIWRESAAYSALALHPDEKQIAVLFEASDDEGPRLAYRAWNEAIRFTLVDLADVGGAPPGSGPCDNR